jgi:chemotaxis signal transduction protein
VGSASQSYLTFRVARRDMALEARRVRAILPMSALVPLPGARADVLGIASLQGQVVAVIDLCGKLGLPNVRPGPQPRIVVFDVISDGSQYMAGFVADRISDVVVYRDRDLRNGSLRGQGRPRQLIDFDQIVSEDDLAGLWAFSP